MAIGNVAAGQVYQAGQTVLKKLTGQLLGNQSGDTGKTPMTIEVIGGGKTAKPPAEETKSLCFPSDLLTDNPAEGNHGHYIQFFINTQEEAKITFGDAQRKNITDEIKNRASPATLKLPKNIDGANPIGIKVSSAAAETEKLAATVTNFANNNSNLGLKLPDGSEFKVPTELISNKTQQLTELGRNLIDETASLPDQTLELLEERGLVTKMNSLIDSLLTSSDTSSLNDAKTKLTQELQDGKTLAKLTEMKDELGFVARDFAANPDIMNYAENTIAEIEEVANLNQVNDQLIDLGPNAPLGALPPEVRPHIGGANAKVAKTTENGNSGPGLLSKSLSDGETGNVNTGSEQKRKDKSVIVERLPTIRLDTSICLFMPASVAVTHTSNYTDTEIGVGAGIVGDMLATFEQGEDETFYGAVGRTVKDQLQPALKQAGIGLQRAGLKAVSVLPIFRGALQVQEMRAGIIGVDRMELAFKGINKRAFQYTFKMLPKSSQEAEEIRKIVKAFKIAMTPEFVDETAGDIGRQMVVPDTFNIQYMYRTKENEYLHKIEECVLETMSVQYGGDRYKTHTERGDEGAPPVETTITLNFKELNMITREKVKMGF